MMILEGGKSRQKRGTWKNDDTKWFFEALAEHGKDFSAIQMYMALRFNKNLSTPQEQVKNREQVRHYYYRTWHKISPFLTFPECVDKQTQELYGLINYGEIWKKLGFKSDSKIKHHLNELVNLGIRNIFHCTRSYHVRNVSPCITQIESINRFFFFPSQTLVKFKGKNLKIKTPICKALKKLHKLDDTSSSLAHSTIYNLPKEITVELQPATNNAWIRVHSLAQNPRIRIRVPLQKRLSELINYLENRWSTTRMRELELASHTGGVSSVEKDPDDLCLFPHPTMTEELSGIIIKRIPINFSAQIDLSLSAFLKKFHQNSLDNVPEVLEKKKKNPSVPNSVTSSSPLSSQKLQNKTVESCENRETKTSSETNSQEQAASIFPIEESTLSEDKSNLPPIAETVRSLSKLRSILDSETTSTATDQEHLINSNSSLQEESIIEKEKTESDNLVPLLPVLPANATIGEWLSASVACDIDRNTSTSSKEPDKKTETVSQADVNNCTASTSEEKYQNITHKIELETLKKGWSKETADMLVGELYLIFKNPPKIILEYDWVKNEIDENGSSEQGLECKHEVQGVLDRLITVANIALMQMQMKNQQNGNDSLRYSTVKAKSYSRKNKRLKLSSLDYKNFLKLPTFENISFPSTSKP